MIVRLLGVASLADAAWQLWDRQGWARFWGKSLVKLRKPSPLANAIAAGQILLGGWLVLGQTIRRRRGHIAKFRVSSGHHPITAM